MRAQILRPAARETSMDVLDQSEVDALLAAVEGADAESSSDQARVFSRSRQSGGEEVEIRPYDFKRPERVSKDQMRAMENLHDGFARSFGAALSGFLRTIIEVKVANIEQMTFSEFTHSLPNPTCFNLLRAEPLEGNLILDINPSILYPIIDRMLGGGKEAGPIPQRPLTAIESRLVGKILDRAIGALEEAWSAVIPLQFKLKDTESNPQLVQIVAPNEVVIVVGFELKMGGRAGTMSLCIPYNVIEPVVEKLSNQTWSAYNKQRRDKKLRSRVASQLDSAPLDISCILANTTIKLSELMDLQTGDIVLTEKPASSPLVLSIAGKRKYIGHIGSHKGNRAFKVLRSISPKDRV